jgi:hypothetical protein
MSKKSSSRTSANEPSLAPAGAAQGHAASASDVDSPPWFRLPIVWMVIGGPAIVVVASFVTLTLAIRNPDPVLTRPSVTTQAEMPAVQARNHAATPSR